MRTPTATSALRRKLRINNPRRRRHCGDPFQSASHREFRKGTFLFFKRQRSNWDREAKTHINNFA
jgi:hypothetical protein